MCSTSAWPHERSFPAAGIAAKCGAVTHYLHTKQNLINDDDDDDDGDDGDDDDGDDDDDDYDGNDDNDEY